MNEHDRATLRFMRDGIKLAGDYLAWAQRELQRLVGEVAPTPVDTGST